MLAVQSSPAAPATPAAPAPPPGLSDDSPGSGSSSSSSDGAPRAPPDSGATFHEFHDGPRPGDKANPFRDQSLNASPAPPVQPTPRVANGSTATATVADSVSSRLAKSQSVIENLQRNLVTKLSPTTIESLKSKYAATPAPLARPDPGLDLDLDHASPLLPVKSGAEAKHPVQHANGKPAAVFDVSDVEGQSSVKLAFLSGLPVKASPHAPRVATSTPKKAVERKPLHGPWTRKVVDKQAPSNKPPVPTKKDSLFGKQEVAAKKKSPVRAVRKDAPQDGLSELLKTLVTDASTARHSDTATDTTASTPRPPKPQPAPRTTSLPSAPLSPRASETPPPSGRSSRGRVASPPSSASRSDSLSPATSPGRTPPERSQLLELRLNEIRKDLWEEEPDSAPSAARVSPPTRLRHDDATPASPTPRSVQEATLEHYARAIQKHLDGQGGVPVAPRLSELHVDTSSSTHSSTSTLVSTPSQQSPGWASSELRSLSPRGRRLTDGDASRATSPTKKRLRDELLGFYYRSLEREARRPPAPGRSGRLSAPPLQLPVVIPTDQATRTPDRTLRQEFIVVRDSRDSDATYQNLQSLRRPPGSPLLASGEDSDSTTQDYSPRGARPRSNMNFFVRGGPQRNTIGSYPTRRTPPRDEVDLRREFGGDVELRHPEKLNAVGLKKRHNSESEAGDAPAAPAAGKAGKNSAWGSPKDGKDAKKSGKANGAGKKSLFPIFRKGSLQPVSPSTPPPTLPKRVSFSSATSPMYASTPNGANGANGDAWPTRNGHAATPPTRVSRLDSSDSVFLPNSPSYYANGHSNGYAEQIYANQYAVAPGEGTYVNYTMPTPPELNAGSAKVANGYDVQPQSAGVYGTRQPSSSVVYGSTREVTQGAYGAAPQPAAGAYGSTKPPTNGVYGTSKGTSNGMYGSTKQPQSGVYGMALQSPSGVSGTRHQPGHSPSNPQTSPASPYGSTQPSPSSEYGPALYGNTVYGSRQQVRQQASPLASPASPFGALQRTPTSSAGVYGTASSPSTPYGTRPPNGLSPSIAYSPSQPPTGQPYAPGASPNTSATSAGSAPSPASTPQGTSPSPYGQRQGGRIYGRTGLPPRAQSATPTMMTASMMGAPDRPLPPIPRGGTALTAAKLSQLTLSESESGSEAGEVQRILQQANDKRKISYFQFPEEEWGVGGKGRGPGDLGGPPGGSVRGDEEMRRGGGRGGRGGRDDPRRHTLGGDQHPHPPQGGTLSRSMDLEMSAKQRKKSPMARGYPPPSNAMLFDDDPGIMSEVETASTGFHRGGKQRSSLPVVRTPSKTLERPLGLVFLQYRSETKRALLPNEITSLDTVKALFVRSFCKQLTMEYLDSPLVKIYIHDSNKDMFYELEDHRSHLRDIHDRSVLRLFESTDLHSGVFPGAGTGLAPPPMWEADQSYFSEPEFDSEYQHQHIHKSKASKASGVPPQPYYMTHSFPPGTGPPGPGVPGSSATLPRGGSMMRAYSPAPKNIPPSDRIHAESGYMSSPERGGPRAYPSPAYPSSGAVPYEEGYYGQYGTRSGSITPVIDEEASDTELMDEQYGLYGVKLPGPGPRGPAAAPRAPFPTPAGPPYDVTRIRVENMERQLANLTGLVQKALVHGPTHLAVPGSQGYRNASGEFDTHAPCSSASQDEPPFVRSDVKTPKLGKDKSVSFEKSVSFSDEPPDMNSPKQHSPQHGADTKPTKPAIKSSTLPRTSSQERDRHKPAPPPKPMSLSPGQYEGRNIYRDLQLTPEMYNQLRGLQKKAKDLRQEVRNLRRMSQAQAHSVRETIRDTFIKIRAMLITGAEGSWAAIGDAEKLRLSREEELYKQEMIRLEKDLTELESTVEELRGNVINRKTRVNMSDVENMALILSKSSKTVADLKVRFPGLQDEMKSLLSSEMDKVMREEKFLKEEPERLESALRRCKKLTGTLVTLKRLASVQEQRLPGPPGAVGADARLSPTLDDEPLPPTPNSASSKACIYGSARNISTASDSGGESCSEKRPENALDALLDELQTFAKPPASNQTHPPTMAEIGRRKGSIEAANPPASNPTSSLRRLHSYPSSSDGGGNSPPNIARLQVSDSKPPVPERNADLLAKRVPPPPPPRTSSRSPLASPTSPSLPPRTQNPPSQPQMGTQGTLRRAQAGRGSVRSCSIPGADPLRNPLAPEEPSTNSPANAAASNSSSCESVNSQEGAVAKKERQEALEQRHQELLRKQRALQEQYARLQQLHRGTATVPTPDLLLKKTGSESNLLAKMGMQGLSAAAPMSGSLTHLASAAASTPFTTAQTTTSKIYETDIL